MNLSKPDLDLQSAGYERIAYATSEADARNGRWTELGVWRAGAGVLNACPTYVAEVLGKSRNAGEVTRVRRMGSNDLDRALQLIDESSNLGLIVCTQAREVDEQGGIVAGPSPVDEPFDGESDEDALAWLFGPNVTIKAMAHALGLSRRTLERALEHPNRPAELKVPLAKLLPFVDRSKAREALNG